MANNILITGKPNVGKTTLVDKIKNNLQCKIGGFITFEKRRSGKRIGFYIEDFAGNRMTMADVNIQSPYRVSKYKVDVEAFEKIGIPAMQKAQQESDLIIVDEIGKMETYSDKFCKVLENIFDNDKPLLATIKKRDYPFTTKLKKRKDVILFTLTYKNRDKLLQPILEKIREII
ncbi:MAG: NTPase [Candidatus Cloacimonetes bacterium]|nr:NTPase [Candidatus Cloacimonadota bacterium]MBS3767786.1 NTPase [Candidatus Cloacimonadota bacterium]